MVSAWWGANNKGLRMVKVIRLTLGACCLGIAEVLARVAYRIMGLRRTFTPDGDPVIVPRD